MQHLVPQSGAGGVVFVAQPRVFARQVEGFLRPPKNQIEGLRFELVEARHLPGAIDFAVQAVDLPQQRAAVAQPVQVDVNVHVVAGFAARRRTENRPIPASSGRRHNSPLSRTYVGIPESGLFVPRTLRGDRSERRLDGGHAGVGRGMIDPGHDEMRPAAVTRVAMCERAQKCHLVGLLGHFREQSAEFDPGDVRFDRADATAEFDRSIHLGIERLDVRGTAPQPDPDDGSIFCGSSLDSAAARLRNSCGKPQSGQSQRPDFEKIAPVRSFAIASQLVTPEIEHGSFLSGRWESV